MAFDIFVTLHLEVELKLMGNVKKFEFYIVDVLAVDRYTGNQLAVFRSGPSIGTRLMQRIAKEMNYSESTFILSEQERNGGYDVRIFMPEGEVPFAGHPTLGTAYIIQQEVVRKPIDEVRLNLRSGHIPVRLTYRKGRPDILWMQHPQPRFGPTLNPKSTSETLGLRPKDIDERFPIQEVSTGLPFIIVPLKTLDAVRRARVQRDKLFRLVKSSKAKSLLVFCSETYRDENHLNVRVFADYYGIPEDAATGSGNGCLGAYLVKYEYFGEGPIDTRVEQGYEMGRPSLLLLRAEQSKGKISVSVGGRVYLIAKGEFV